MTVMSIENLELKNNKTFNINTWRENSNPIPEATEMAEF